MRTYDVLITPDAYDDLAGIRDHIARMLGSPEDARSALRVDEKTGAVYVLNVLYARGNQEGGAR